MDGYERWKFLWDKVENMPPEERIRWEMENECTCGCVEGWWEPSGHFSTCPLMNPEAEMWVFFEGVLEGFVYPKRRK